MTIKQVCQRYGLTQDTLRYYEKIGVIPPVHRSASGIRDYDEHDLGWVENAVCLRSAGVPVESIAEYDRSLVSPMPFSAVMVRRFRAVPHYSTGKDK